MSVDNTQGAVEIAMEQTREEAISMIMQLNQVQIEYLIAAMIREQLVPSEKIIV